MPPQTIHILRFFCDGLAAPDFVMKMYWGQGSSVARSLEVLQVSYIIAFSDWRNKWCAEYQRRHSLRKIKRSAEFILF